MGEQGQASGTLGYGARPGDRSAGGDLAVGETIAAPPPPAASPRRARAPCRYRRPIASGMSSGAAITPSAPAWSNSARVP